MSPPRLRVAVMPTAMTRTCYELARSFARSSRAVDVSLEQGWATLANLQRLVDGDLDALVVTGRLGDGRVLQREVGVVASALYLDGEHPLAAARSVTLAEALEQPTFRRPEGVDAVWHSGWLMTALRGGEPAYSSDAGADELDVQRIIGTGRATGIAPTTWCRRPGIVALPIIDADPVPVLVATRPGPDSPELAGFLSGLVSRQHLAGSLSTAERRVVSLVADGLSNREIASALHVSVRTVESHVSSALRRRGARSRTDLVAAWWHGEDPVGAGQ